MANKTLEQKVKKLKKEELVKLTVTLLGDNGTTPAQRECMRQHLGECGTCSASGHFTPCA